MRANEFVVEADISDLKRSVAGKIISLPDTPSVEKTLDEIEDILNHVNAGGKLARIEGELVTIPDRTVQKERRVLARDIAAIDMTAKQRDELFKLWREDKIVNRDKLLSGKNLPLSEIFNGYANNTGIRELVDVLSIRSALGQGKGEFLLSVLSRGINKMSKGDLRIDDLAVEVKTLDGGAGRFFDQEVKPASEYNANRDAFLKKYKQYVPYISKSGMRVQDMIDIAERVKDKKAYEKDVKFILQSLFPGQNVDPIATSIMRNNIGQAKQLYAKTNLNYYFDVKKEKEALDGVLYIDLSSKPMTMMFFKDFDDLQREGLRLHASTTYPVTSDLRNAYPQIRIVPTKQGIIATTDTDKEDGKPSDLKNKVTKPASVKKTTSVEKPKSTGIKAVDRDIAGDRKEPKMRELKR